MERTKLEDLALRTVDAMMAYGLKPFSAWEEHRSCFLPIISRHKAKGCGEFNRDIVTRYVRELEERLALGDITERNYRGKRLGAQRLTEMHDTGKLEWSAPVRASKFQLNAFYEEVLAGFVAGVELSPKSKSDATWVGRKHFAWLIQEGHNTANGVGADEIQRFMIFCSKHMRGNGLHNVKLYMKKLYSYLAEHGHTRSDHAGLFAFPVSRETRLFPALPPSETAAILDMADRRTPKGKRDYAIILMGAAMGLRAIDIARLCLTDIDWRKGEIRIVQSKTGKSLALPLTKDVGEALQDYILNGRRESAAEEVFLSCHAPFRAFSNGVAIEDMYDSYRKRAGLPRDAHDGKGFHALRRSMGKNLVTSGVPVTMVAQVFGGNENIDSVKKYIALDSKNLKECALGFAGIAPEGGGRYE